MNENQFVMVSEWMVNGNINEFVRTHRDADLFKLVWSRSCCRLYLSLTRSLPIARRRHLRVDLCAQPGDGTRRLEGGMVSGVVDYASF